MYSYTCTCHSDSEFLCYSLHRSGGLTSSRLQEEFRQAEATFKRGTSSHMHVHVLDVLLYTNLQFM